MRTIDSFGLFNYLLKPMYFNKVSVYPDEKSFRDIIENNPKLVWAVSHGPGFAPAFITAAITDILLKNGGAERTQMAIAWKHFYKIPLLKQVTQLYTQLDHPPTGAEIVQLFAEKDFNDFVVYPEGENAIFGDGTKVEKFVSPRFLEVAINAGVPILVAAHYGSQNSASIVHLTEKNTKWIKKWGPNAIKKLAQPGDVYLPGFFKKSKTDEFKINITLYQPKLTKDELYDPESDKEALLAEEADVIKALMQGLLDEIVD
jgi:hypothetical protein